ncbi:MAG: flavin reductase [Clostridia bacterium]|nr:flavin reductase [Clostridia bacterium]
MKEKVNVFDYAEQITKAFRKGILLNTNGDKFNSMVIGWGHLGVIWGKQTFAVYVRENRYTKAQLDKTQEFTLSVPLGEADPRLVKICGLQSGHRIDKVKEAALELEVPEVNQTPGIKAYPLTIECRVLYQQRQDLSLLPDHICNEMYPQDVDSSNPLANCDPHTMYIGEIVSAYLIKA